MLSDMHATKTLVTFHQSGIFETPNSLEYSHFIEYVVISFVVFLAFIASSLEKKILMTCAPVVCNKEEQAGSDDRKKIHMM